MRMILFLGAAIGAAALLPNSAHAQSRECRDTTVSDGGRARMVKLCRDPDGQWRQPTAIGGSLAANFRGKIVYQGSFSGYEDKPTRMPRRLSLGSAISALSASNRSDYTGTITYTVEYDGNLVTGAARWSNGRQSGTSRFTGTKNGSRCNLFDEKQSPMLVLCDAGTFRGEMNNASASRSRWHTEFDASATETVDYVERDRAAAAARAEAEVKARAARAAEMAERARMRAKLPKGAAARYTPLLNAAVVADSAHWFANRYASGSIDLIGVQNDPQSGSVFLKAYFKYAGGNEGFVGAIVKGQRVQCLAFADDPSGCRGIGDGANAKMARGFMSSMLSGGGGGSGNSAGAQAEQDLEGARNTAQQMQNSQPGYMGPSVSMPSPAPLPVPCVGGPC